MTIVIICPSVCLGRECIVAKLKRMKRSIWLLAHPYPRQQ